MNTSTFICYALLISLPLFLSSTVATSPTPLLVQTCKKTDDYALCLSSLSSDPRTASARDAKTLALIELDAVSAKAIVAMDHIGQLLKNIPDPRSRLCNAYATCAGSFQGIVKNRVPEAIFALNSTDYAGAIDYAGDVQSDVSSCLKNADKPPFTDDAQVVENLAGVAIGIIKLLH